MARSPRHFEPERIYFVTNRCFQSRLLMRPSPEVTREIGAVLARATQRRDVDLFAFTFLSNHMHMLLRARDGGALSAFVRDVEADIARRVGDIVGWKGSLWDDNFAAEPVLDDDALVGRLRYIGLHGVKEGLVERAEEWPGLTCLPELLHGVVRSFDWLDRSSYHEAIRRHRRGTVARSEYVTRYELKLAVLPCWADLEPTQRQALAREVVLGAAEQVRRERAGKPVLGVEAIVSQDPHSAPLTTRRSPPPLCHTVSLELRKAYEATYAAFKNAYRKASQLFRQGVTDVSFPEHAFLPPLPWRWRPVNSVATAVA